MRSKKQEIILSIIMAIISTIGITISLNLYDTKYDNRFFDTVNGFTRFLTDIYYSMSKDRLNLMLMVIGITCIIYMTWQIPKNKKSKKLSACMAGLFSVFHLLGISFDKTDSWDLLFGGAKAMFKAGVKFTGYFIILYCVFLMLFAMVDKYVINIEDEEHAFEFSMRKALKMCITFFASWLPWFIIYFPGISTSDTAHQILAYFHYNVRFILFSPAVGQEYYITAHHPPFITFLVGTFAKIGLVFGENITVGMMLYSLLQMLLFAAVFTAAVMYLQYIGVGKRAGKWIKMIYMFYPLFILWSFTIVKDTLFSVICLALTVALVEIVRTNGEVLKYRRFDLSLFIIILLTMLTKNQGVYIIFLIGIAFLIVYRKKYWKHILMVFATSLVLYQGIYVNMLLPALNVMPGGTQEILSLPFQQTARFVKEHEEEVTSEEEEIINQVLDYDSLAELYDPLKSDAVKFTYNQHASREELVNYFKVWFKHLLRHPGTYVQAAINGSYGYFYTEIEQSLPYSKFVVKTEDYFDWLEEKGYLEKFAVVNVPDEAELAQFEVDDIDAFSPVKTGINGLFKLTLEVPGVGLLFTIGFYSWMVIICLVIFIYQKKGKYLLAFSPVILSMLILILSPTYCNRRYIMPLVFELPFMIGFIFYKEQKISEEGQGEAIQDMRA